MDQKDITALYYGCWRDVGHYFWSPFLKTLPWALEIGLLPWPQVDGVLCPGYAGKYHTSDNIQYQSQAASHCKAGWTALATWDKTVDNRPASNSVFLFRGEYDFDAICKSAAEQFHEVWNRINLAAPVTIVQRS